MPLQSAPVAEKVVVRPHPGGAAGAMMSLDEVAKRMWSSRNDPRVRAWATRQLVDGGNPTGARDKMQVILDAFRRRVKYVPDPVHTEFMAGAVQTLCLDESKNLCIVGADCDDQAIALGASYLSVGIPVQVVGASYKEPTDQPSHVYIQAQDDMGVWVPVDPTTKFEVGNVHATARTWIIEPNKGVSASGQPGGDFVGVGRAPDHGLGALSYEQLLAQAVSDATSMRLGWASIQQQIAHTPPSDPCGGVGGPAALVPALQAISDQACTIAHNAARAAFGYSVNCGGAGADSAQQAEAATVDACDLKYAWKGPQWGPYGTMFESGQPSATCLDDRFTTAVGLQVAAAERAVAAAQATAAACEAEQSTHLTVLRPGRPTAGPRVPVGLLGAEGWGLGVVTPGDVLSYRAMWNQYVLDTVASAQHCATYYQNASQNISDPQTKATLQSLASENNAQASDLLAMWNIFAGKDSAFIVLQAAQILKSYQQTVITAGQVRGNITSGAYACDLVLTCTDQGSPSPACGAAGQLVQATPGADPSVQAQVIARIEGLGILTSGVLQILVETGENTLAAAGSAAQWVASNADKAVSALATPWPWIVITTVAGAVIVYEMSTTMKAVRS